MRIRMSSRSRIEVTPASGNPRLITAPEVKLEEDEERNEGEPQQRRVGSSFDALLASFRAGFARKKTAKTEADGADSSSMRTGIVESEAFAGPAQSESGEAAGQGEDDQTSKRKPRAKRGPYTRVLLGGVAAVAVVAAVAGFALMSSSRRKPVVMEPGMIAGPQLLAPAASLASVPKPEAVPAPEAPWKKAERGDPLQEILALKAQDGPAAATKGPATQGEKPAETAGAPPPQKPSPGVEAEQKATPTQGRAEKSAAGSPESAVDGAPREPAGKAAAKPMVEAAWEPDAAEQGVSKAKREGQGGAAGPTATTEAKEEAPNPAARLAEARADTATLDRVTQLAALVAHLSDEVNALANEQAKLKSGSEERFADLQRRMALSESSRELKAAEKAQSASSPRFEAEALAKPDEERSPLTGRIVLKTGPSAAPSVSPGERRSYRIQAASPSLAMLGTGDNAPPLEVAPGTTIPGYGRVSKIEQRGQSWVVVTDQGVIQ